MNLRCKLGLHQWQYKTDVDKYRYRRCKNPQCSMYRWELITQPRKPW